MSVDCNFAVDGRCMVSTKLCGLTVLINDKACIACIQSRNPKEINGVTCSRAADALRKAGFPLDPELMQCIRSEHSEGPGTVLSKLLSLWGDIEHDCNCNEKITMMNRWGVAGCSHRIDEITSWLVAGANARHPWLRLAPKRWYLKHLVKKAIRVADNRDSDAMYLR